MSFRKGVTTISSSSYIDDAIAGKIILGQGWNGDVRRIVQGRKKQGDITAVLLHDMSEIWSDNWCIPSTAPHPVAAHAWINWLLHAVDGGDRDGVPQLRHPDPLGALAAAGVAGEGPAVQRARRATPTTTSTSST